MNLRSPEAFSEAVKGALRLIKEQQNRDPPSRQGFLRLIKEIADFHRCLPKKAQEPENSGGKEGAQPNSDGKEGAQPNSDGKEGAQPNSGGKEGAQDAENIS